MRENSPQLTPELKVSDFQRSLDFYVNLVGFEILYDRPEEEFAMLELEGSRIMLEAMTTTSRNLNVGTLEYPFGRGINFQIEVSDIVVLYEIFKSNKYPLFIEIEDRWYRKNSTEVGNRQFLVQDPDGYLLRFFQDMGVRSL